MSRIWNAAFLSATFIALAMPPAALQAKDQNSARTYHDKQHNDDHQWNGQEDKAYHMWAKETHHKPTAFAKINVNDQQAYWNWRHEHSDALLKIDIR